MKVVALRLIFVLVLLCAIAEVFTRAFLTLPANQQPDEELGWTYRPHSMYLHSKEGFARTQFNKIGLNDDDNLFVSGKKNVAVLGDSYTEAVQVSQDENFVALLDDKHSNANIINAGRSGIGPVQYLAMLRRLERESEIDSVIVVLTRGDLDEIRLNMPRISRDSMTGKIIDVSYQHIETDSLKELLAPISSNSALAVYLMRRFKSVLLNARAKYIGVGMQNEPDLDLYLPVQKEVLEYVFSSLGRKHSTTLYYIPKLDFHANGLATESRLSQREAGVYSEVALHSNVRFLNMASYFIENYKQEGIIPFGFNNSILGEGHLNLHGHKVVAAIIGQQYIK